MKTLALLALMLASTTSAFAANKVPNCFTKENVAPAQFIIRFADDADYGDRKEVENLLGQLGMSIINETETMILAEAPMPKTMGGMSPNQQAFYLKHLETKVWTNAVAAISCNGIMKAF